MLEPPQNPGRFNQRAQHSLASRLAWLGKADERADRQIAKWDQDIARRDASPADPFLFEVRGRVYGEKDREALLSTVVLAMRHAIKQRAHDEYGKVAGIPVGRYRGFEIQVYARAHFVQFELIGADGHAPENLRYQAEDAMRITGFIQRIDNYLARFDAWRVQTEEQRQLDHQERASVLAEQGKPFSQQARLEMLREDVRQVMTELKLMQADDSYVSQWQPQSLATGDGPGAQRKSRMAM